MRNPITALLLAITLCAVGCGANVAPQLVATEDAVHDALAAAQDGIDKVCASGLTPTPCQQVNAALVPALQAGAAFNRGVRDQRLRAIGDVVKAIGTLVSAVQEMSPGEIRDAIVADLRLAIDAAFAMGGQSHE